MNQTKKAALLTTLHVKGPPLQLFNVRDTDSAQSILDAARKRSRHFRRTES